MAIQANDSTFDVVQDLENRIIELEKLVQVLLKEVAPEYII